LFNTGTGTHRGIVTCAPSLSASVQPETPPTIAYHGPDGAFTIEALVRFDPLPGAWTSAGWIVAMEGDGDGTPDRVFQFRINPSGGLPVLQLVGSIGEVRISSIARAPDDFLFADAADHDSLPDTRELLHFGNTALGPLDDPAGDGTGNRVEFLLGIDPAGGSSAFRATIQPAGAGFTLGWPTVPGLTFRVERSTTLVGDWLDLATVSTGAFTDPNPPSGPFGFGVGVGRFRFRRRFQAQQLVFLGLRQIR
jgi:hypothetical protein